MTWKIVLAESPNQKTEAAACILRALPDWFGNIQARESYIEQSAALPVLIAYDRQQPIGFLALQETSPFACEICVMGVFPAYQRHGIGTALVQQAIAYCKKQSYALLHVKTLDSSCSDAGYARTRAFYRAQGFLPLQCLPEYWDQDNPCLLMVLPLSGQP